MAPPKASLDVLQVMHAENKRQIGEVKDRVGEVEKGQKDLLAQVNEVKLVMTRIETMLTATLALQNEVKEIKETVDGAKGMGTLVALGLAALDGLTGLWVLLHGGKG